MATIPDDAIKDSPVPQWLALEVATMQATQNIVYNSRVSNYRAAVATWIEDNVLNRNAGLPIAPFTLPKPQRVITYAAKGDSAESRLGFVSQYLEDVDPSLPDAVLPPPVATKPSIPILGPGSENTGGSPGGSDAQFAQLNAKLDRLIGILKGTGQ